MKSNKVSRYLFKKIFQLLMKLPFLQNIRILFYFIDSIILMTVSKPVKVIRSDKKKVVIVFPFALGDCILFGASVEKYREVFPKEEYTLSLLIPIGSEDLFAPYVDEIISFNFTIASVNPLYRRIIYKKLREQHYDILIDPYSCEDCTPNIYMSRAICSKEKIGFVEENGKKRQCPDWIRRRIYSRLYNIDDRDLHRIIYYRKVLEYLGVEAGILECMNIPKKELSLCLPAKYFVVFPSASMDVKKWEIDKFLYLIKRIINYYKLPLVLSGTESDRKDTDFLKRKLDNVEIIDLVGGTSVLEFCEVIGGASFLVTNDTSAYHIGVAKDVKTFLISGGYVFNKFAQYPALPQNKNQPVVIYSWRNCFNCNNYCKYNARDRYPCIEDISVEKAWICIKDNLGESLL